MKSLKVISSVMALSFAAVLMSHGCSSKHQSEDKPAADLAAEDFVRRFEEWDANQEYLSKQENDQALKEFDSEVDGLIVGKPEGKSTGFSLSAQTAHIERIRKAYAARVKAVHDQIEVLRNQNAAARQRIAEVRAARYLRPVEKNNVIAGIHNNINARIQQIGAYQAEIAQINAERVQAVSQAIAQVQASQAAKAAVLQAKKTAIAAAKQRKLEGLVNKLLGKSGLTFDQLSERDKVVLKRFAARNDLVSFRKQVNLILTIKSNLPSVPAASQADPTAADPTDPSEPVVDPTLTDDASVDAAIAALEKELSELGQ